MSTFTARPRAQQPNSANRGAPAAPADADHASPSQPHLRVGVLGPLAIEVDGRTVDLRGRSLRLLVCRLLLERGDVVPEPVLLHDIWGPGAAAASLHTAVARVRRALEPDRPPHAPGTLLERTARGYRIALDDPDDLDAARFERGLDEAAAREADRIATLRAALAEWRGEPFADAADVPFAAAQTARLRSLRLEAEEQLLGARAALQDRDVVADLESFALAHPTREHAWELLVVTLCRHDRVAEALAALRTARRHLIELTGMGVGPRLQALQSAVLRREPALFLRSAADRAATTTALLPRSNVPVPVNGLLGRGAEIEELRRRLREARLITVTGPGGVGKTRLAVEAARDRADEDGPWFVELAEREADQVVEAVRRVVGLTGVAAPDAPWTGIGDRRALLVLDNCEHLIDTVAGIAAGLLAAAPHLTVLTTSRQALGLPGESVLHLGPLATDPTGPAVSLFRERAAAAGRVDEAADEAVLTAICERLDGLPLAIELAAARTDALSDVDLLRLIGDRFALLRRTRGGTGRQNTMLATIDWSYRRLSDDERAAFAALAVFAGGFTLDAAAAVIGRPDTMDLVARLVATSMVQVVGGRPRRYRLLETLRDYAIRCTTPDLRAEHERRHLQWVLELAADADTALRGRLSSVATATLHDESGNIRAALRRGGWRDVLRIGGGFYWFWYREGLTTEGLDALSRALASADASGEPLDESACARAAMGIALLSYLQGDRVRVGSALERAGLGAERSGNPRVLTQYLSTRAYFEAGARDLPAAQDHAAAALQMAEATADAGARAESLMVLGEVARCAGDLDLAARRLADAAEAADEAGYTWAAISSLWIGAKVAVARGRIPEARDLSVASTTRAAREGERTSWLVGLATTAHIDLVAGEAARAATLAGAAEALGARIGFSTADIDPDLAAWFRAMRQALFDPVLAEHHRRGAGLAVDELQAVLDGSELVG